MKHCISRQKPCLVVGDSRPMSKRMLANCFRPPARLSGVRAVATQPNGSAQTSKLQQLYQQALSSFGKGQQPKGPAEVLAVSEALSKSGHLCSVVCTSSVSSLLSPPSNILFRGNSPAGTGNANRGQCFPGCLSTFKPLQSRSGRIELRKLTLLTVMLDSCRAMSSQLPPGACLVHGHHSRIQKGASTCTDHSAAGNTACVCTISCVCTILTA